MVLERNAAATTHTTAPIGAGTGWAVWAMAHPEF